MKKTIITILTIIFALNVQAQTLRTSYFMDKYNNRHQRNPAMSPAWGYLNFPGLGHMHIGLQSNMRLSDFLFPVSNGQLGTFLHPEVTTNQFLRGIGRRGEALSLDANFNVLGFGFYTRGHEFWSFDLNVRAQGGANIPRDFFAVLKEAEFGHGNTYNLRNLNASVRAYTEFAFGHARDINDNIRVGGKLKFLVGLGDARFQVDNMSIHTTPDIWTVTTQATGTTLGNFFAFEYDEYGVLSGLNTSTDNIDPNELLRNWGLGLDMGVVWQMGDFLGSIFPMLPLSARRFTLSAGLTDLGFINYRTSSQVRSAGEVVFEGGDISFENSEFSIDLGNISDRFSDMIEFRETGATSGMARGLRTTANIGLEYSFLDNMMSAGLLWSSHFGLPRTFNELTLSYNLRPVSWFALSLSSSVANGFFRSAGWAMNFTPRWGLNFFFGMDYIPFAWTPPLDDLDFLPFGVPINSTNFNFNFGMSIPLGSSHDSFQSRRDRRNLERHQQTEGLI